MARMVGVTVAGARDVDQVAIEGLQHRQQVERRMQGLGDRQRCRGCPVMWRSKNRRALGNKVGNRLTELMPGVVGLA